MKLTKALATLHQQACDLVFSDKKLTEDETFFILENYHEAGHSNNALAGAFFTPIGLAADLHVLNVVDEGKIIDLCAGIGRLAYFFRNKNTWGKRNNEMTCIEINYEYVEVGKRVLPEANWINASIFDIDYRVFGQFDLAISNPPFGKIKTASNFKGKYKGAEFEFKCLELASQIAHRAAFILPSASAPFSYSNHDYVEKPGYKYRKFLEKSDFQFRGECCGVDPLFYADQWRGLNKQYCQLVSYDFMDDERYDFDHKKRDFSIMPCPAETAQMNLF